MKARRPYDSAVKCNDSRVIYMAFALKGQKIIAGGKVQA
jgi:hypothetical protein